MLPRQTKRRRRGGSDNSICETQLRKFGALKKGISFREALESGRPHRRKKLAVVGLCIVKATLIMSDAAIEFCNPVADICTRLLKDFYETGSSKIYW